MACLGTLLLILRAICSFKLCFIFKGLILDIAGKLYDRLLYAEEVTDERNEGSQVKGHRFLPRAGLFSTHVHGPEGRAPVWLGKRVDGFIPALI